MIAQKICEAMKEIGYFKKDKVLEGFPRYPYLSEELVTAEAHAVFARVGIAMMPIAVEILENRLDHTQKGTEMHNTRIRTTFRLIDAEDASYMDIQTLGEGSDTGDKTLNKCMTAAYKYAIRQTLMISTGDDPDAIPSNETRSTKAPLTLKPATPPPTNPLAWFDQAATKLGHKNFADYCSITGINLELAANNKVALKVIHDAMKNAIDKPFDAEEEA